MIGFMERILAHGAGTMVYGVLTAACWPLQIRRIGCGGEYGEED